MIKFNRRKISDEKYEACSVFDVDGDGIPDIVSGGFWYKGPDFKQKFKIWEPKTEGEYFDDFSSYPLDITGNGKYDIITGGWWGEKLKWLENNGEWTVHEIAETGSIETTRFFDIDGCGTVEIFPNTPGRPQSFFKLENGAFKQYVIGNSSTGHGMGFGDIDGDGKTEIILCDFYLKQTGSVYDKWAEIPIKAGNYMGSVPILVYDVNKSGLPDIIKGNAHGYGLYWYEQIKPNEFIEHLIDGERAQYHDMQLVDIDNDGQLELVTGKRYRAHCGNDPGDNDNPSISYFKVNNGNFERFDIEYGDPEQTAGTGIYFWLHDFSGNGYLDIVAPGKTGLYLFENLGN